MNDKIASLAYELKELMDRDPRFLALDEKEKALSQNEEAMKLAYQKDMKEATYSDLLKIYEENQPPVIQARKELYEAKKALDSLQVSRDYYQAYGEVRLVLAEINDLLFSSFSQKEKE